MKRYATIALVFLVLLSGCVGSGSYSFEAGHATIENETQQETGYEQQAKDSYTINQTKEIQGEEIEITLKNKITTYKSTHNVEELGGEVPTGYFSLISTPSASIAGITVNPIAHMSNKQILNRISGRTTNFDEPTKIGEYNTTMLGNQVTVSKFRATTTYQGQEVDLIIHMGKTTHEDDLVIGVGLYPERFSDLEEQNIKTIFKNLDHSGVSDETTENSNS